MRLIISLSALLFFTPCYSAHKTTVISPLIPSAFYGTQHLQQAVQDRDGKEEKALRASETVMGQLHLFKKSSVPSLMELATEQLTNSLDPEVLHNVVDDLIHLWTDAPKDDFNFLLKQSEDILDRLFPALPTLNIPDTISAKLYVPVTRLLLNNPKIAQQLMSLPLYATIGRWPFSPKTIYTKPIFNTHGYLATDTATALYIFNTKLGKMLTIPHTEHNNVQQRIALSFSCDGSTIAQEITVEKAPTQLALYDTHSGECVYSGTTLSPVIAAPRAPLFTFRDQEESIVTYNCLTKKISMYPTVSHVSLKKFFPTMFSSQGTFSLYVVESEEKGFLDMYLHNNEAQDRYLVLHYPQESSVKKALFNDTESMLCIVDATSITLFTLNNLVHRESVQKPYLSLAYHQPPRGIMPMFSPDGTQLLIPGKEGTASIFDLPTQKILEKFTPDESLSFKHATYSFLSQNTVMIVSAVKTEIYIRDKQTYKKIGDMPVFSPTTLQLAYRAPDRKTLDILDLASMNHYSIATLPPSSFNLDISWHLDDQGTLLYREGESIEQCINPTQCSIIQLFFLVGLARSLHATASKQTYQQLLASPLLETFSPIVRTYLTKKIQDAQVGQVGSSSSSSTSHTVLNTVQNSISTSLNAGTQKQRA